MMAWYRNDGAPIAHARAVDDYAEQDGDVVEIDGHRIDGAELLRVETLATYRNGGCDE